jgi:hypothetical protein
MLPHAYGNFRRLGSDNSEFVCLHVMFLDVDGARSRFPLRFRPDYK